MLEDITKNILSKNILVERKCPLTNQPKRAEPLSTRRIM